LQEVNAQKMTTPQVRPCVGAPQRHNVSRQAAAAVEGTYGRNGRSALPGIGLSALGLLAYGRCDMKNTLWMVAVMAMVLGAAARTAAAQEDEELPFEEQIERQMMELELRQREDEVEFERQERELELEQRRAEIDRARGRRPDHHKHHGFLLLLIIITNILLTVWVFKDMNEKKIGRALWVPIVLLAGVFGAILYAIVRIADTRQGAED